MHSLTHYSTTTLQAAAKKRIRRGPPPPTKEALDLWGGALDADATWADMYDRLKGSESADLSALNAHCQAVFEYQQHQRSQMQSAPEPLAETTE